MTKDLKKNLEMSTQAERFYYRTDDCFVVNRLFLDCLVQTWMVSLTCIHKNV